MHFVIFSRLRTEREFDLRRRKSSFWPFNLQVCLLLHAIGATSVCHWRQAPSLRRALFAPQREQVGVKRHLRRRIHVAEDERNKQPWGPLFSPYGRKTEYLLSLSLLRPLFCLLVYSTKYPIQCGHIFVYLWITWKKTICFLLLFSNSPTRVQSNICSLQYEQSPPMAPMAELLAECSLLPCLSAFGKLNTISASRILSAWICP